MAGVPNESVISGASADEFKRLWQAKKILEQSNVYIDDTAGTTPEQIMSKCRRLKQMKKRLDFVLIDYLQLLKAHTSRQSIQQEVTEISRSIKIMAKELDVPVFALSQTSRDLEKRDDGDPKMSDLRESGAIEQDADQVYFLVKKKAETDGGDEIINLNIVKHRSGPCGVVSFKWEGNMYRFTPTTFEEARNKKQNKEVVEKAIDAGNKAENDSDVDSQTNQNEQTDYDNSFTNSDELVNIEDKDIPPVSNGTTITYSDDLPQTDSNGEPNWGSEFDSAVKIKKVPEVLDEE